MAPTEGRFAMPERQWDCCRGTPLSSHTQRSFAITANQIRSVISTNTHKCRCENNK